MPGAEDYILARRNLIQVLETLRYYTREAIVVVGAQAVYLRTERTALPFSPFTLDSDLVVDPRLLQVLPPIRETLATHGYTHRKGQPGLYWAPGANDERPSNGAQVDILVPEEFALGNGRRDANLPGENGGAARRTAGLEATLYDRDLCEIADLEQSHRVIEAYVAGPAALILAKAEKIAERSSQGDPRLKVKDVTDVFRVLRGHERDDLERRFRSLAEVKDIAASFAHGIAAIRGVFVSGTLGQSLFVAGLPDNGDRGELLDSYGFLMEELGAILDAIR